MRGPGACKCGVAVKRSLHDRLALDLFLLCGEALTRMRGQGYPSDARLASLARDASPHDGPWPTISVWQGSADGTVVPINADRIVAQWRGVHGLGGVEAVQAHIDGCVRLSWVDDAGKAVLEFWTVPGMGPWYAARDDGPGRLRRERCAYARSRHILDAAHRPRMGSDVGERCRHACDRHIGPCAQAFEKALDQDSQTDHRRRRFAGGASRVGAHSAVGHRYSDRKCPAGGRADALSAAARHTMARRPRRQAGGYIGATQLRAPRLAMRSHRPVPKPWRAERAWLKAASLAPACARNPSKIDRPFLVGVVRIGDMRTFSARLRYDCAASAGKWRLHPVGRHPACLRACRMREMMPRLRHST